MPPVKAVLTFFGILPLLLNGVSGQTVVTLERGTATFTDVTIPGTGGTVVSTAGGQQIMQLDIFGSTVFPAFQNRVTVTSFNNGFSGGKASFVIRDVQKSDAGNFQCQSQFEGQQPCGSATLVVAGTPSKPVLNVLTDPVVVGGDVIVECKSSSTSVPASSALKLTYNLKENGRLALQQPTPASRFKISSISKAKTGARYACVAYELNTLTNQLTGLTSEDSNVYTMNPLFGPEVLVLTPAETNYAVSSNDAIPDITCSADCNPACTINWYKDSQIFQSGPTLVLGTADKTDAGNYFCRARNSVDTQDTPLLVTVEDKVSTPELIPPTADYTVPEGTTMEDIFCRADCTPACTYAWLKDGQRLLDSQGIRLGTVGASSSGTYTCQASNGEDSSQVSFVLDVQYPPREPVGGDLISPSTSVYQVEEGALVLPDISCVADCNPTCTVQWTKAGGQALNPGNILSLGAASRDDTGRYTCTATNSLGQTSTTVDVNIEFRPEQLSLSPDNSQYNSVEGVDVIPDVRCSAICNPECVYEWYKGDGGTVLSNTAVLSLGAADRDKTGTYMCRVRNKVGEATKTFSVVVLYGPAQVVLEPPQDSYTVPSGTLLPPVSCSADCNPACTYKWVKDDSPDPTTTLRTLTLGQADPQTAGIYKCVASNPHGSANTKFDLTVQFGPASSVQLQPPQSVHDLSEGDDLTVTCDATCDPSCDFRWEDASGNLVSEGKSLQLSGVTSSNTGTYSCVADNGVGTPARRSITVNVLIGPSGRVSITPPGPVIQLRQGNSLFLSCSADCLPACTYTWFKDSVELAAPQGLLTLNDVDRDSQGAYTCQAVNSVGTGAKDIVLDIQYGPGNSITFNPDKTSHPVEENSDLTVTCAADCKPECDFVWKRGSTDVARGAVLFLEALQRNQAGTYTCTADNAVNQPTTKQITVDVLYGPDEVRLFPDEQQLYPLQDSTVSLKCWAVCNPDCTYAWFRGSTLVPSVDGELDLRNVTTSDSGNYLCQASNNVGNPASRAVDINVRAGPGTTIRFNPPDDTAVVVEGRQLKVECIAECSPPCTYEWRKGSTVITDQSTLDFAVTDRSRAGSYICFASNAANSQASKPFSLDVQYGPGESISLFPPGRNQSYTEGAPFTVKCSADCQPDCTYTWYLGPTLLPYDDGVLFSDSASLSQAGTYTCQASNGIGSATSTAVTIDVQTGPGSTITFSPPGERQVVKEGDDLVVFCSADCSPPCTYKWVFDSRELLTQNGRLELPRVNRGQKGLYSCVADNGFGNQGTKPLTVDVEYGPESGSIELFPSDNSQVLNEGASISLKCSADCSPACSYTWYLGNDAVNSTGGVLSLVAVGPEDAGTYRCTAQNSIGLASSDIVTVVVQTGPGNTVKIQPEGDVYNVTEGEQLRMKCSAVCSPACTYTWYFGFDRVKSDDGILVIDGVTRNKSGPFVCYAANDVGLQGSRLIQVDVLYGPVDGIVLDPAFNVTVIADNPFSLRCSANCHPPCSYAWFQGPLPRDSVGGKLAVGKATTAEGGFYTCRATNSVGSMVSDPVVVEVQYGPRDTIRLDPPGSTRVIREGDDVIVTCSADCKPQCDLSWFAGYEPVLSEEGRLTIPNFRRTMPRFYSCFADNGLGGRAMAALEVQVQYGPGDMPVLFPDTSPLSATVGGSVSVQCSAECSPQCTYTWTKDGEVVFTATPGVLQLRGLRPDQSGTYSCTADNGIGSPAVGIVDVVLQSGPGASIRFLPPGLAATVPEGGTLQVTCAADCVPDCDFTWTRGGQQVSANGLLLLTNAQRNQQGVYQCNARNSLGVNVTQQLTVTVEHGPRGSTKLFPPEETRNLNRGETLIVQCSALCSPPCSYTWRKGAQQLSTEEGVLLLPNVTPDDRGRYTCTADNQRGPPESVNLAVKVNFGPEDTVTFDPPGESRSLLEGENLEVRCSAQCLPACSYTWYLASRRLDTGDGLLVIPAVTRQDAGTYTCHADNGVGRRMSQELLVDVQFPPNTPTFDPATTTYTLRERIDSVSDIRCYADCNPRCDIEWLKDGAPLATTGNVLALPIPDRSADGVYTCVASNVHGKRGKELTINVNYAPSIAIFTINDRKTVATVPEKYPVTVNCRVSSKPPSTIQIYNGTTVIQEVADTLQAKYSWRQAECLDAGTYSCTADNGVGALVSVAAELKVLCLPRLDPRVFKQPYVAAEQGQTAVITVPVLADPAPSFLWYKIRDGVPSIILQGSNDTQGQSDKFFTVNGTTSTLTIENVQLADFGDYVVSIANDRGNSNFTFSLVPQSAPYQARNLTARPVDAHTVEVTWSPGFNGGSRQQFLLEYLKEGTNGWRTLQLDPRINDVTRSISLNVSDLNPSTPYTFRLRSKNAHGLSNYSNHAKVQTYLSPDNVVTSGEVNPTPVLMGVGLALGFLVGAGITAIVVVSRCRPKTAKHGENTIDDFRSDTTYDTLYLRDALWAQRHIKMRQNSGSHKGGLDNMDGYDYKQPEDTVRGFNDYSSSLKPVGEMRTSL